MGRERREKIDIPKFCRPAKGAGRAVPSCHQEQDQGPARALPRPGLSPGAAGRARRAPDTASGAGEHLEQLGTFGSFTWRKMTAWEAERLLISSTELWVRTVDFNVRGILQ